MDNKRNSMVQTHNQSIHEYVDLGLPSGTLWATENIKDANGNEMYFAWGETKGYTAEQVRDREHAFSWNDHKFSSVDWDDSSNFGMTKYNKSDHLKVLEPEDDAATQNWGAEWKIPTKAQFEELLAGTTQEWKNVNGVNGLLCTSKTSGNDVFFPAVGGACEGRVNDVGYYCDYWSVSLDDMNVYSAWDFYFYDGGHVMYHSGRCCGCSVRPVRV